MILIGIDPGISGGISVLWDKDVIAYKMPETETDIVDFFRAFNPSITKAIIEKVHGMPKMSGTAMFSFGKIYGTTRTAMIALKIPFDEVSPQTWMKSLGCMTKGDKNISKARAQQLYPHIKCTHAIADSLLILEYLRQKEREK